MLLNYKLGISEAGCDEAGRGCLAGPVYAASVILPPDFSHELLNDSKQVSEVNRNTLRKIIEEQAIDWSIGIVSNEEIDEINILNASFLAMHRAIDKLKKKPKHLLIDGNRFNPYKKIKHQCIIGGDALYLSIAAASILAKTHRDEYMQKLHQLYPEYDWLNNKGYPTVKHRQAIITHGISEHHRKSFQLIDYQLKLNLEQE